MSRPAWPSKPQSCHTRTARSDASQPHSINAPCAASARAPAPRPPRAQRVGGGIGVPAGRRRRNGDGLGHRGRLSDERLPRRRARHLSRPRVLRPAPRINAGTRRSGSVVSLPRVLCRVSVVVRHCALAFKLYEAAGDESRAIRIRYQHLSQGVAPTDDAPQGSIRRRRGRRGALASAHRYPRGRRSPRAHSCFMG